MRNYMCCFCQVRCDKVTENIWTCHNCETQFHIDLWNEPKYHYLLTRPIIKYGHHDTVKNETIPEKWHQVKSDFITNTSIIYQVCNGVRYKVKEVPLHLLSDRLIRDNGIHGRKYYEKHTFSNGSEWTLSHWIDYSLFQQDLPEHPPQIEFICQSCNNHCVNSNPRYALYWHCDPCNATYYLDEDPPHKLRHTILTCPRDEHTVWCFEIDYKKNTTTLSYQEDKCSDEVLKLDFAVTNVTANNLQEWIRKKLLFL